MEPSPSPLPETASVTDDVSRARKEKARRRLVYITIAVVAAGVAYWSFESAFSMPFARVASFESNVTSELTETFSAPPPLTFSGGKTNGTLTVEGVIAETNAARASSSLPALDEDATLDDIARLRLDDMFSQQYFAHVGPQGESAETVASSVGYSYLALGENLAEGDFASDGGVVAAWMASPGHRANILGSEYTEIGVAAGKGTFDGRQTWIAVQIFGRPASDCATPNVTLQPTIAASEQFIGTMENELSADKAAISAMQPQSGEAYNEKVGEYNSLVAEYNTVVAETKSDIAEYDAQVEAFNTCLEEPEGASSSAAAASG